jgi:hypothetical protein
MGYVLKLDPRSRKPHALLRTRSGSVDRWDGKAWQETALTAAQLDGLGGDSDYYSIKQADLKGWQKKLPAS